MIDCFIRTLTTNTGFRDAMFRLTYTRWEIEADRGLVRIHVLRDVGIREGRMFAEVNAESDPYIYTDDDVVIHGKDWVKRGTEVMLRHPEYAIASTLSLIESENAAVGPEGAEIYPMHWVGAPMWIRKGILGDDLPEMDLGGECRVIHEYVTAKGYKEGLIAGIRHVHLGYGFSSNPNLHWGF